jgi:colanic acid/amylovoran biosynthesis protein
MRILMKSDQTFGNLGDAAMLRVAVTRLQTYCPNACLDVLTPRPDEFLRLFPHVNVLDAGAWSLWADELMFPGRLYRLLPRSWLAGVQQWESSLREHAYTAFRPLARARCRRRHGSSQTLERFFALLAAADAVVVPGGGNLNDAFPYFAHGQLELAGIAKRLGKRVAFFGQGLGPIRSACLRRRASRVLRSVDMLALREGRAGLPLARSLGLNEERIVVTGDDAIEPVWQMRPERLGDLLGLNVRIATYAGLGEREIAILRSVLAPAACQLGTHIIPIPIDIEGAKCHSAPPDIAAIARIIDRTSVLENLGQVNPSLEHVIETVGRCRVVVTGSYHAGVFAMAQGISVVALAKSDYYFSKFEGLADQFGAGCHVVNVAQPDAAEQIRQAVSKAWSCADEARPLLLRAAETQVAASRNAYRRFLQWHA